MLESWKDFTCAVHVQGREPGGRQGFVQSTFNQVQDKTEGGEIATRHFCVCSGYSPLDVRVPPATNNYSTVLDLSSVLCFAQQYKPTPLPTAFVVFQINVSDYLPPLENY